ncbi:hypothetical protein [Pseudomonas tolaasii]
MQKVHIRLLTWVILPGLFLTAIQLDDPKLAIVGAVLAWAIPMIFGPLTLIAMCVAVTSKPGDASYEKDKAEYVDGRPGSFARVVSWIALGYTVAVIAYAGFLVTAVFYLLGALWCKLAYAIILEHFKKGEAE